MNYLKNLMQHLLRLQFWFILFVETLVGGLVLMHIDSIYSHALIPRMFWSLSFPYFGLCMVFVGVYSLVTILQTIRIMAVLLNAAVWAYISVASMMDVIFAVHVANRGLSALLLIVSIAICIRIFLNALNLDLTKEKEISKETFDEGAD